MAGSTLPASSQLRHTPQSFADWSRALGSLGGADEGSRALRAGMGQLSEMIEAAIGARRAGRRADAVLRSVQALQHGVRVHQMQLTSMDSAWHVMYEFSAYQRALRELGDVLERWRLALSPPGAAEPQDFAAFELQAWRVLGEGLLVLDIYEQGVQTRAAPLSSDLRLTTQRAPLAAAPRQGWWQRLRRWLGRGRTVRMDDDTR